MNEQDQTIKTNALLTIEWLDQYLSWNTGDFGDIESILVKQNMLWLPDIVVDNTVTTQTELGYKNLQVALFHGCLYFKYRERGVWKPADKSQLDMPRR